MSFPSDGILENKEFWAIEFSVPKGFLSPLPMAGPWNSQSRGCIADSPCRGRLINLSGEYNREKQDLINDWGAQFVE